MFFLFGGIRLNWFRQYKKCSPSPCPLPLWNAETNLENHLLIKRRNWIFIRRGSISVSALVSLFVSLSPIISIWSTISDWLVYYASTKLVYNCKSFQTADVYERINFQSISPKVLATYAVFAESFFWGHSMFVCCSKILVGHKC